MNINVGIIDQQVRGLAQRLEGRIEQELDKPLDETTTRSVAFVVLCAKVMLGLTEEEATLALTEGGNDFGVDAIEVGDLTDGEFVVTLLQGKYHHANLDGVKSFPQSGVEKAVQAVRALFNPAAPVDLNPRLQARIEEVRSLILDGNIPRVRFLLCSNGESWKVPEAQAIIDGEHFGDRATFEHVNHDLLVQILGATQPVRESIKFTGKSLTEDIQFVRVFIGKVAVSEIARIMEAHGDRLLDRNIRRYLGLHGNRVNEAIRHTLTSAEERPNFFFYNNGVTLICERFDFNALQSENHIVRVEGLQIINGGQTSKTIQATFAPAQRQIFPPEGDDAHVLVRLYQVPKDAGPSVQTITFAINSQNPVDLQDLRSGDERQQRLEMSMRDLGFEYRRQRSEGVLTAKEISVGTAAEAVLSVWRERPQRAKFRQQGELFDKSYEDIFTGDLTAAQVVIAVMLFRIAENKRKRPPTHAPELVRYASNFIAMLMGRYLLSDLEITSNQLDHRRFEEARKLVETSGDTYFDRAVQALKEGLDKLYGGQPVSPQRLAATFRRGDLFTYLQAPAAQAR
ncbi:MAG: AIPR family protein [Polyangiaceae bacterium]|nr:AIPR family protein [Polyangiaceae bacterium]